jgi:hypothetical protein
MPRNEEQDQLDRVLYHIFQKLMEDTEFSKLIDEACLEVVGVSTPALRSTVRQAFQLKVGM